MRFIITCLTTYFPGILHLVFLFEMPWLLSCTFHYIITAHCHDLLMMLLVQFYAVSLCHYTGRGCLQVSKRNVLDNWNHLLWAGYVIAVAKPTVYSIKALIVTECQHKTEM